MKTEDRSISERATALLLDTEAKLKAVKVCFAVPSYDGKVCVQFLHSFAITISMLQAYGITWNLTIVQGDCYVARARNELASNFLRTDFTHLFFIDSDMGWDPAAVIKLLARDKDLILGAYHLKNDGKVKKYVVEPIIPEIAEGGAFRVISGPTGFMCVRRNVFARIATAFPNLLYSNDKGRDEYAFFHCSLRKIAGAEKNSWYGEDIDFCHKWVSLGGEIWCEPDINFDHVGQKVWTCNLASDLKIANIVSEGVAA